MENSGQQSSGETAALLGAWESKRNMGSPWRDWGSQQGQHLPASGWGTGGTPTEKVPATRVPLGSSDRGQAAVLFPNKGPMLFPVGKTQSCPLTVPGKLRGAAAAPVLQHGAEGAQSKPGTTRALQPPLQHRANRTGGDTQRGSACEPGKGQFSFQISCSLREASSCPLTST